MKYFLLLSLFAISLAGVAAGAPQGWINVDPNTRFFFDDAGRVRVFHGVNAVYKVFPYIPSSGAFDPENSLGDTDINNLVRWGFNVVRLGFQWQGLEPQRGQFNMTLLNMLVNLVNKLAAAGIYTIIDAHQDLMSPFFCGEGFPDFAANSAGSLLPFPLPAVLKKFPTDPKTGYPLGEYCGQYNFGRFYFSMATECAFQNFFKNVSGIWTNFGNFWANIARQVKNNPYVLGYEIINEPWPGAVWNLKNLNQGDRLLLQPLYDYVASRIRPVDDRHLIFFEPSLTDQVDLLDSFEHVPGGAAYQNRSVFSYHIYCVSNRMGDPINTPFCDLFGALEWNHNMNAIKRLKTGGFLTEFGAMSTQAQTGIDNIKFMTGQADNFYQSWAWWQFKAFADITTQAQPDTESFYFANGTLQTYKVKLLARTYAYAVQGLPQAMAFDPDTANFSFSFIYNAAVTLPTEIFYSSEFYYPKGIALTTQPPSLVPSYPAPNRLSLTIPASVRSGSLVAVQIVPM